MRIFVSILALALLLTACSETASAGRRTDGEEAVALAVVDALRLKDFDALEPVMVSPQDVASQQGRLSKAEMADSSASAIAQASWSVNAEDLPRDLARAQEMFAVAIGQGIDAGVDWENIEYEGYQGVITVKRDQPARIKDFFVTFTYEGREWRFFVPSLQRYGSQWKITGFKFQLFDENGMPSVDMDSWDNGSPDSDDDSWEVTDEDTSE